MLRLPSYSDVGQINGDHIHTKSAWCAGAVNVISPFRPITREEAANILKVSLSTLDNIVAAGVMPAPRSIPGSRRKYWHPEVFYPWLNQQLRPQTSVDAPASAAALPTPGKPQGRRSAAPTGIADRARARNAQRLKELNE
jgi:excisionase family DNA binding protein